jgi:hypothetical protein
MMVFVKYVIGDSTAHIVIEAARDAGETVLVGYIIGLPAA